MEQPLINIITRASRKDKVKRSIDSVLNQSYKNIHHIITYENKEIYDYLLTIINPDITTLVKVPQYKKVDDLYMTYMHHDHYSKFLEPNWEFLDRKVVLGKANIPKDKVKVETIKFQKYIGGGAVAWCVTLDYAARKAYSHFPPNLYLKIAESRIKKGWVIYLDDDDVLSNNTTLENVVGVLSDSNEDTLHFIKVMFKKSKNATGIVPTPRHWEYMNIGHPPVLQEIGSSHFIYHSKYRDYTVWDEWRGADYRTAKALFEAIPHKNFINSILVNVN